MISPLDCVRRQLQHIMFNSSLQKESEAEGFLLLDGKEELGRGRENKFLRKPPNCKGGVEGNRVFCSGRQQNVSSGNTGAPGESSTLNQPTAKHTEIHNWTVSERWSLHRCPSLLVGVTDSTTAVIFGKLDWVWDFCLQFSKAPYPWPQKFVSSTHTHVQLQKSLVCRDLEVSRWWP